MSLATLVAIAGLVVEPTQTPTAPAPTALEAFRAGQQEVTGWVQAKAKPAKIRTRVDAMLDYEWIATASLGGAKHYRARCTPRCEDFETSLTKLIRHHYLQRVERSANGTVEYLGEQVRPRASRVATRVRYRKNGRRQQLLVEYIMHRVDDAWRVRDIYTDEVSLTETYRSEFKRIHAKGGIDAVIDRLDSKLAKLKAD